MDSVYDGDKLRIRQMPEYILRRDIMSKRTKKLAKAPGCNQLEVKYYVRKNSDCKTDNMQQEAHEKSEDVLIYDGIVYECIADDFEIDLNTIPDHVKDELAFATLEAVHAFLNQPGGREMLDSKKDELKKQKVHLAAKASACTNDD